MGRLSVPVASEKSDPALIQPEPVVPRLVLICHHRSALSRPVTSANAPSGKWPNSSYSSPGPLSTSRSVLARAKGVPARIGVGVSGAGVSVMAAETSVMIGPSASAVGWAVSPLSNKNVSTAKRITPTTAIAATPIAAIRAGFFFRTVPLSEGSVRSTVAPTVAPTSATTPPTIAVSPGISERVVRTSSL